jgi:hypothetical protein
MSEAQRTGSSPISRPLFLTCRFSPVVIASCLWYFATPLLPSVVTVAVFTILELYFMKEYFATGSVGLRWYFSCADSRGCPFVAYWCRPLPYVASTADLNCFWVGLILPAVTSVVVAALFAYFSGPRWGAIGLLVALANILNFVAFIKCHRAGSEQADSVAKTILLDTNISFQSAKDPPDDQTASDDDSLDGEHPKAVKEEEEEEIV